MKKKPPFNFFTIPDADLERILLLPQPVLFFDTARPDADNRHSYLFINPSAVISARSLPECSKALGLIDNALQKSWIAGYCRYEAAYGLEQKFIPAESNTMPIDEPLIHFGIYHHPHIFDHSTGTWNRPLPSMPKNDSKNVDTAGLDAPVLIKQIDQKDYISAVKKIRNLIARGETYQVNYTFRLLIQCGYSINRLYRLLRLNQPVPYGCYSTNEFETICSFSPELFFEITNGTIRVRPMKGTAPRGRWPAEDQDIIRTLRNDPKNRSENVMIVDLLRNDLGKICKTNSIKVPDLFTIETHPSVHQMTSTITGSVLSDQRFSEIFSSLFPCGSVTGAPKIHTMEIIRKLEPCSRGIYCGAIGFAAPNLKRVCFNVPIRTLSRTTKSKQWSYGVGSGIIGDSKPKQEWQECADKCSFLTNPSIVFELFDSMLWHKKFIYLKEHLARLQASAAYFNFSYDTAEIQQTIRKIEEKLNAVNRYKIRLFISAKGIVRSDATILDTTPVIEPVPVAISDQTVDESNRFLFHKTTHRPWYACATEKINSHQCFEVLFFNSKKELTEGARSNVFIKKGGILYTPPLACGLLPGVLRERMVTRGKCREKVMGMNDLKNADEVYVGNSVRGLLRAEIVF